MVDVSKLKKGDKVRFTSRNLHANVPRWYPPYGTIGVVVRDADDFIQWPEGTTGGDGRWYAGGDNLKLVREASSETPKIVVEVSKDDPAKVIAKELASGKTGVAKCNPADTFDFYTGAKLAFERLCKETAKPVCKFKIGDIIIGNKNANRYGITREGWVGVVTKVYDTIPFGVYFNAEITVTFAARRVNSKPGATEFALSDDAFDLV